MHSIAGSRRFISNLVHFQCRRQFAFNTIDSRAPQSFITPLLHKQYITRPDRKGLATSVASSFNSAQSNTKPSSSSSSSPSELGSTNTTAVTDACPTTITRPRLSPLPYIFLRNLPYVRSTDLQERLVERQLRFRKKAKEAREASTTQETHKDISGASIIEGSSFESNDVLLIVEHTPTYTNGRRNRGSKSLKKEEIVRLENLGATYVESFRGGEITFHGPGQLVAYPILDLKPIELSVRCYVSYLEKAIIATCADMNIKAITTENTGVWINDQKKIAAIGVHVQRYITSHGLALNCNTNLDYFKGIVACGLTGKETTSLSRELDDPSVDIQKVIPSFLKGFGSTFNRELVPLQDVNPELEVLIRDYVKFGDSVVI